MIPDEVLDGHLNDGVVTDEGYLNATFAGVRERTGAHVETELGRAGWFDFSAEPYPPPTADVDAPEPAKRPVVRAVRRVWLAKYNPTSADWWDPHTGRFTSDVNDEALFPWSHPEIAVTTGNYWLSTRATPKNAVGIFGVNVGDLVFVQRMDPGPDHKQLRDPKVGADNAIVGVAIAAAVEEWDDADTGRRERRVTLMPAARCTWPVPRNTARRHHHRLTGHSFRKMPQCVDGTGQPGFTLGSVTGEDIGELLAVCGVHPEALTDTDLGRVAARLRATLLGNQPLWRLRWDHVFRHSVRYEHEQAAVAACKLWARQNHYPYRADAQFTPNAGYDLVFADFDGQDLEVEVKGYMTRRLAEVTLQRSQLARAKRSAAGRTPRWLLFALLGVGGKRPLREMRTAQEVVDLVAAGGLTVRS